MLVFRCLNDDFISCSIEKGTLLPPEFSNHTIENVDNLSDSDFEENVLHRDILFNLLIPGSVIALYSPANARQLLILWSYSRVMLILVLLIITTICDVFRDLLPFVQLKKREKHPWKNVIFCKVYTPP